MKRFTLLVNDYEHSGDINAAIARIQNKFPDIQDIKGYEIRDFEAESDYREEYGELDEYIYQGYVTFMAPEKYWNELKNKSSI